MRTLIDPERVLGEVRSVVIETLRLDDDIVQAESSCIADLGAESLDFLDINYQVEQIFGIKMARHFFLEHAEEVFGEGATIDEAGRVTGRGVELLRQRYGDAAGLEKTDALDIDTVPTLITVGAIADAVCDILDSLPDSCGCGAADWATEDGTHVLCSSCREPARYSNGDEIIRLWLATRTSA